MYALAKKFAALKGTKVIEGAHKLREDGTITFVLEAGPKLTMTEAELRKAIADLEVADRQVEAKPDAGNIKEDVLKAEAKRALAEARRAAKAEAKAKK